METVKNKKEWCKTKGKGEKSIETKKWREIMKTKRNGGKQLRNGKNEKRKNKKNLWKRK